MSQADRKISKAIYLLLEKYHRLYGLEIYLFSGGHGSGYVGFQIAANPCCTHNQIFANYHKGDSQESYGPLVTYLCGSVGIPAWTNHGEQLTFDNWQDKRTTCIVEWLEEHLAFQKLFDENASKIAKWRTVYTVAESEKYLLMVNLAGLLAMRLGGYLKAPSQCLSDYDHSSGEIVQKQLSLLGLQTQNGTVMGQDSILIARNGRALIGTQVVDVWEPFTQGKSPLELVDWLLMLNDSVNH